MFWSQYVKHFEFSPVNFGWSMQQVVMNLPIIFRDRYNEAKLEPPSCACILYFLWKKLQSITLNYHGYKLI